MNSLYFDIFKLNTKSFILLFKTPCLSFLAACTLYSPMEDGRVPLYSDIIEIVLQKKESTIFCSVYPNNLSSFSTFGGIVFIAVGFDLTIGKEVISFTGS